MNTDLLRDILNAGLTWLYETVQPDTAMVTHHGVSSFGHDRLVVSFAPSLDSVVVISVKDRQYDDDWYLKNPLTDIECNTAALLLTEAGHPPIHCWNGAGLDSGSFRLAGATQPSLLAAVRRYTDGCPTHPKQGVFCTCPAFINGYQDLIPPVWPGTVDHL